MISPPKSHNSVSSQLSAISIPSRRTFASAPITEGTWTVLRVGHLVCAQFGMHLEVTIFSLIFQKLSLIPTGRKTIKPFYSQRFCRVCIVMVAFASSQFSPLKRSRSMHCSDVSKEVFPERMFKERCDFQGEDVTLGKVDFGLDSTSPVRPPRVSTRQPLSNRQSGRHARRAHSRNSFTTAAEVKQIFRIRREKQPET